MAINCDPHICMTCAAQGATCCSIVPGTEEFCFPVSEMEWARIREAMGGAVEEKGAFAAEMNTKGFLTRLHKLFPDCRQELQKIFPAHRPHLRLATRLDGACVFLGPQGCALEREARPYYCRLFPLWVQGGRVVRFGPDDCIAAQQGGTEKGILRLLDMSASEVLCLHGRLRLAWGLSPHEKSPYPTDSTRDVVGNGDSDISDSDES